MAEIFNICVFLVYIIGSTTSSEWYWTGTGMRGDFRLFFYHVTVGHSLYVIEILGHTLLVV